MSFGRLGSIGRGFGRLGGSAGTGGGGSAPPNTLIAGSGSFILSGETMTPLVDYLIPSGVGAFTLTGQNVTLDTTASGGTARQFAIIDHYLNTETTTRSFASVDQYVVA
jgi:hypothetical protein